MASRRNHYGDGYSYGGAPSYGAAAGGGGADAFPAYGGAPSPSRGGGAPSLGGGFGLKCGPNRITMGPGLIIYDVCMMALSFVHRGKHKRQLAGAAPFMAIAIGVLVVVVLFLSYRTYSLSSVISSKDALLSMQLKNDKDNRKRSEREIDQKTGEAKKLRAKLESVSAELDRTTKDLQTTRLDHSKAQKENEDIRGVMDKLSQQSEKLSNELAVLKEQSASSETSGKQLEIERERAAALESKWASKENEWIQEKKMMQLDLELAQNNLKRLELELNLRMADKQKAEADQAAAAKKASTPTEPLKTTSGGTDPAAAGTGEAAGTRETVKSDEVLRQDLAAEAAAITEELQAMKAEAKEPEDGEVASAAEA